MRKSELVGVPKEVSAEAGSALDDLSRLQVRGSVMVAKRQEIKELEAELRPAKKMWLPPKGFLRGVTSASNKFDFVEQVPFITSVDQEDGFRLYPEIREFTPPQPDGRYVFLADSLNLKNQNSVEPGTVYAVGCFATERVRLSGDDYEVGVVAADSLPELIANTPIDLEPGGSRIRRFGTVHGDGLTIRA